MVSPVSQIADIDESLSRGDQMAIPFGFSHDHHAGIYKIHGCVGIFFHQRQKQRAPPARFQILGGSVPATAFQASQRVPAAILR